MSERIDWSALMRAGVSQRGLRPAEFWDLTPAELLLVLGVSGSQAGPMSRGRLMELMARWPDKGKEASNG